MTNKFLSDHHNAIQAVLEKLNPAFFENNNIMFGGGTRIALELNEYRESIDIDFICPNTASYRAIRSQVTTASLGDAITVPLTLVREIRSDRYGVRTVVQEQGINIKLEFVSFDDYKLSKMDNSLFPVPCLDHDSCFITKLLAHSDRGESADKKDFIDLMVMVHHWGVPSTKVWVEVERHYGDRPKQDLLNALATFKSSPNIFLDAAQRVGMNKAQSRLLFSSGADIWNKAL